MNLLEEAMKAKNEGLIKHISFSFHDSPENMRYIIDNAPMLETVLVQYNLLDRSCEDQIKYAASKGLGVVAMGPVGGGRLAAPAKLYERLTGKQSLATYELALKFVIGNPDISCALSGMQTMEMMEQNCAVASKEAILTVSEWQNIADSMEQLKKFNDLYCTGCNYCQPCPQNIAISRIFNDYTYYNVYDLKQHAIDDFAYYMSDPKQGKTIKDCIDCGYCEDKCPQKIKIRDELRRVEKILLS
jgi:predicted aldo/keto reductase-like oxidoreductase